MFCEYVYIPRQHCYDDPQTVEETSDMTVCVGNKQFKCHKLVLMSHSQWFHDTILPKINEKLLEIPLKEVDPDLFAIVWKWMYTCRLDADDQDLLIEIRLLSEKLKIPVLIQKCKNKLMKIFDEKNIMDLYETYLQQNESKKLALACEFILEHYYEIISGSTFLTYRTDQVCWLLSLNGISVQSELDIFEAALRWLKKDWKARYKDCAQVLCTVRFGFLNDEEILDLFYEPQAASVMEFLEVREMLLRALLYHVAIRVNKLQKYKVLLPPPRKLVQKAATEFQWQSKAPDNDSIKGSPSDHFQPPEFLEGGSDTSRSSIKRPKNLKYYRNILHSCPKSENGGSKKDDKNCYSDPCSTPEPKASPKSVEEPAPVVPSPIIPEEIPPPLPAVVPVKIPPPPPTAAPVKEPIIPQSPEASEPIALSCPPPIYDDFSKCTFQMPWQDAEEIEGSDYRDEDDIYEIEKRDIVGRTYPYMGKCRESEDKNYKKKEVCSLKKEKSQKHKYLPCKE